jgi:hypothetical protein
MPEDEPDSIAGEAIEPGEAPVDGVVAGAPKQRHPVADTARSTHGRIVEHRIGKQRPLAHRPEHEDTVDPRLELARDDVLHALRVEPTILG